MTEYTKEKRQIVRKASARKLNYSVCTNDVYDISIQLCNI